MTVSESRTVTAHGIFNTINRTGNDSYDRIIELVDSEGLAELEDVNKEYFNYWNPKHYIMYLDGVVCFNL